jgi:hypothetical protein
MKFEILEALTYYFVEHSCLPGCGPLWSDRYWLVFQRSLLPPSETSVSIYHTTQCCVPEDRHDRSVCTIDYTMLRPRRQPSSYSSPWEPHRPISPISLLFTILHLIGLVVSSPIGGIRNNSVIVPLFISTTQVSSYSSIADQIIESIERRQVINQLLIQNS